MPEPRVALDVRHGAAPLPWGSAVYVRRLAAALAAAPPPDLAITPLGAQRRGPELLWEQLGLTRELRRGRFEAVHGPHCFLPLRRPCPGVVTIHDLAFAAHPDDFSTPTRLKFKAFVPAAVRSAERVICVSEFTRADVCRRYRIDTDRTRVVPLAPALPITQREPPQGPYLLAVGALREKKNLLRLVHAVNALRRDGLEHRLVLAGPDAGMGAQLKAASETELELPGTLADDELDALMRGAELLVHPSLYEGFGLAPVEAMARGVPVALARATALTETGGDAALYFDPLDEADIANAIRQALTDADLRENLRARGRERTAALSWERVARETAAVYRELL